MVSKKTNRVNTREARHLLQDSFAKGRIPRVGAPDVRYVDIAPGLQVWLAAIGRMAAWCLLVAFTHSPPLAPPDFDYRIADAHQRQKRGRGCVKTLGAFAN